MPETIHTFEDWVGAFHEWQEDIGFPTNLLGDFTFEAKYADEDVSDTIEFGDFEGQPKWKRLLSVPHQNIRDALLNLIVYQGDTEFASVEQQRHLLENAPTEYDRKAALRVMAEEQRHGWQMCHLLTHHFGEQGCEEAKRLLERRSWDKERLLGSFNEPVDNWVDFFVFTQFVDRDGKYQLKMLSRSAFKPLASSMGPMLKEEAFHLGTGNSGIKRVLQSGKVPTDILQKYYNKWIPTAHDLFGTDNSSSAHWAYVWGLKGRFDEGETDEPVDKDDLNDRARRQYHDEIQKAQELLNRNIQGDQPQLVIPDMRFNRGIGRYKGEMYDIHGAPIESKSDYQEYLVRNLPSKEDTEVLADVFEAGDWIATK
ncbi:MAG: phenylacetate-CoA oxygenase subunit PaaI [Euryarchaeota archaeon]|nr:phenylacetate-CoA oxygenase subunit PaaI [Euryarchaeota archaeon]